MSLSTYISSPLVSAGVRRSVLRALLAAGVLRSEIPDLLQETLARAVALPPRQRNACAWHRLVRGIARNVAREHLRRRGIKERYDVGPCGEPDQLGPLEQESNPQYQIHRRQELLGILRVLGPEGLEPTDAAIVQGIAEDVSQAEIARELGLKPQTVRNRLCLLRQRVVDKMREDERRATSGPQSSQVPGAHTTLPTRPGDDHAANGKGLEKQQRQEGWRKSS